MQFFKAKLLALSTLIILSLFTGIKTQEPFKIDGKSLTEFFQDGIDKLKEQGPAIKKTYEDSSSKIKTLFLNGNDSQYLDLGKVAENGKIKLDEAGKHMKNLFFDNDKSQLVDVNKIANTSYQSGVMGANKIKDLFLKGNKSEAIDLSEPAKQTLTFGRKVINFFTGLFTKNE